MITIISIALLTLVASIIGTIGGFGLSTIMIPLLLTSLPVAHVLLFVGIIHACEGVWKMILFRSGIRWNILITFGIPAMVASTLGSLFSLFIPSFFLVRLIGLFLICYSILIVIKPHFSFSSSTKNLVIGGVSNGFISGISGKSSVEVI